MIQVTNITEGQLRTEQATFMTKVYKWMAIALTITGLTAFWVAHTPKVANFILGNSIIFYGLLIAQLVLVGYLSAVINKVTAQTAKSLFLGYSILNGLTMSTIFLAYTSSSIATAFFITAGTFAFMSIYGYYTKRDLTSIGNIAFMALIGLIIASLVNMFFQNEYIYWITSYAGVLIFVALTAYDTQKIKAMAVYGEYSPETEQKQAIIGALSLYLDFINLFQHLLRIFGNRKE